MVTCCRASSGSFGYSMCTSFKSFSSKGHMEQPSTDDGTTKTCFVLETSGFGMFSFRLWPLKARVIKKMNIG